MYLARIDKDGKFGWRVQQGGLVNMRSIVGMTARSDGALIGAGQRRVNNTTRGALFIRDANGKILGDWHTVETDAYYSAVAERADTSIIVAGASRPPNVPGWSLLVAYSNSGKELWKRKPAQHDGVEYVGLVLTPDGGVIASGISKIGGARRLAVARHTAAGDLVWKRTHQYYFGNGDLMPAYGAIRLMADGGVAIAAHTPVVNKYESQLTVRTDPSGHVSCRFAGTCAGLKIGACDDKKPCTVDWCDPKKGCQHGALTGISCGVGKICKAGTCAAK